MAQLVEQSLPILQVSGSNPVKILQLTYLLFNCWKKTGSPGLVVMGRDSCSEGREFKSQHIKLDGLFPQLFVVRIVMFVWRGEDKWKRGRCWPILKKKRLEMAHVKKDTFTVQQQRVQTSKKIVNILLKGVSEWQEWNASRLNTHFLRLTEL